MMSQTPTSEGGTSQPDRGAGSAEDKGAKDLQDTVLERRDRTSTTDQEDFQRERLIQLKRSRGGHASNISRKHSELKIGLERDEVSEIEEKLMNLKTAFANFDEVHARYMDLATVLEPEEARSHEDHRNSLARMIDDVEYEVSSNMKPHVTTHDSVSQTGSQHSRDGSASQVSSTSSARARAAAKKAGLIAKASFLQQQQEHELRLQKERQTLARLKIEAEISAAAAEEDTLAKIAGSVTSRTSKSRPQAHKLDPNVNEFRSRNDVAQQDYEQHNVAPGHHEYGPRVQQDQRSPGPRNYGPESQDYRADPRDSTPDPRDYRPDPQDFGIRPQQYDMGPQFSVTQLAEQLSLHRLPPPEPEVFSGDPLGYTRWKTAFESLIESKAIKASERIYYLSRYLAGEAKVAVEGYLLLNTDQAYHEAKALLHSRYGDQFMVSCAFRKKLEAWPKVSGYDGSGLRNFSDFLMQCGAAMDTMESLRVLDDIQENQKILRKLPDWIVSRWARCVQDFKEKEGRYPPFRMFVKFLKKEADLACDPVTSIQALKREDRKDDRKDFLKKKQTTQSRRFPLATETRSLATDAKALAAGEKPAKKMDTEQRSTPSCLLCKKSHLIGDCHQFLQKKLEERSDFVKKRGLCFGCLKQGHITKQCRNRAVCSTCQGRHPTALHRDDWKSKEEEKLKHEEVPDAISHASKTCDHNATQKSSLILPVWISHKDNPGREELTYALLDTQSDATFIIDTLPQRLGLSGAPTHLLISTMTEANKLVESVKFKGLVVRGYDTNVRIPLPAVFAREAIPANRKHIPTPEVARQWPHLARIAPKLMPLCDADIGILIGYNCPRALAPREVIAPSEDAPFAQKTDLGWGIVGITNKGNLDDEDMDPIGPSHHIVTWNVPQSVKTTRQDVQFVMKTEVKEVFSPTDVAKILGRDFTDIGERDAMISSEDREFLDKMKDGIHKTLDGHYEMPLPFKGKDIPTLPDNKPLAVVRSRGLKRKLEQNDKFHKEYTAFIDAMIENGHAEKVPEEEKNEDGHSWYIPHHGVYHPRKNKLRIVFDASAKYKGASLNETLLQGPDLTNALIGVLCRFRKETVAFMCDIKSMFHQFRVNEEHRNFLKFLWWESGDLTRNLQEYRMTVHLFGAKSSPGCANFGLKMCATDNEEELGTEVADFIRNEFYVDDGLKSVKTLDEAIHLVSGAKKMCEKGGIHLHKFVSNSKELVSSIPKEDRSGGLRDLDILKDSLPVEAALGIQWCVESDTFRFNITLKDQPETRRGILSTVSAIYDPLGFIAPLVLEGKRILQELCREGTDWDEQISEEQHARWERWKSEMLLLEGMKIERCYKPKDFGEVQTVEIHNFSDASTTGYGQCSYLRQIDDSGRVHCALVMAKARVAPLKPMTIPRLELTAALVSVRVGSLLDAELQYEDVTQTYWTDSEVVLGYISNEARRFHIFVANRVQQIRDRTESSQWRHVKSQDNPADHCSRGLRAGELTSTSMWLRGPDFLWEATLPDKEILNSELSGEDSEVRKQAFAVKTSGTVGDPILERLKKFSDWKRAIGALAHLRRLAKYRTGKVTDLYSPLTIGERQEMEEEILRKVQREELSETPGNKRKLDKLDSFTDGKGLLRAGGRLKRSSLQFEVKHPIILPKSYTASLLVKHHHEMVAHQGRGITTGKLRDSGLWIIGCSKMVSSHIHRCVTCRKLRGTKQDQKMADLPEVRTEETAPFTFCGMDCFGPFIVHEGRKELKRYGLIFTCMASRAVHIEVLDDMTTDAFINGLRCFVAIRGPVRTLYCDQGTNFVGASHELKSALKEIQDEKIRNFMMEHQCDFQMNTPSSSHMGGVWERQIRTVRSVLEGLLSLHGVRLDTSTLRTFLYEAMAIVNSRPLGPESLNDPCSLEPISPNQLLTMKSQVVVPLPGIFVREDVYARKRWRKVQFLANEFWARWKKEYLLRLQERQKWNTKKRNFQEGDVVLLKEEDLVRARWRLARVVEIITDGDGCVRKAKLLMSDPSLSKKGLRESKASVLERPIHKLVLVLESPEGKENQK